MAQQMINIGISANDGTGDTPREAGDKINDNFTEVYAAIPGAEPGILPGTTGQYWRGDKTWQTLDKTAVGLGSVDNTADAAKNVLTATKLLTGRTIAISGDMVWSVTFDGSGNVTSAGTLATVNSNTGTYGGATTSPQIAVNGKGLITGVSAVTVTPAWSSITSTPTTLAGYSITGTKANFDAACTDGNFLYVGDVATFSDEAAQDAVGAMVDTTLVYVDATPLLTRAALTGDITAAQGSNATTLATVNANVGSFGSATQVAAFTVNAKGLTTAASNITITPAVGSITGLGTGVATALGVNIGSAGAPVLFNGAGGTPSSLTLTNATGLPLSTGVTGDLPFANLTQGSALSVLGVTGNSTADVASIVAANDGEVLRRSGTSVGFGTLATAAYANDSVTYAKLQDVSATSRVLGRKTAGAGNVEELDAADITALMGLGNAATKNTGTSGNNIPLLDGAAASWTNGATFGGPVGVGAAPTTFFDVVSSNFGAPSLVNSTHASGTSISTFTTALEWGHDSAAPYTIWWQVKNSGNTGTNYPLSFNPLGGNVGIGTLDPQAMLEVAGSLRCDSFRIDQSPTSETIVCTHTLTISVNGTNYKIPMVAA